MGPESPSCPELLPMPLTRTDLLMKRRGVRFLVILALLWFPFHGKRYVLPYIPLNWPNALVVAMLWLLAAAILIGSTEGLFAWLLTKAIDDS